jgi:hypothetical protein
MLQLFIRSFSRLSDLAKRKSLMKSAAVSRPAKQMEKQEKNRPIGFLEAWDGFDWPVPVRREELMSLVSNLVQQGNGARRSQARRAEN